MTKKDADLLAKREILFNQHTGPRIGDYVEFPDQYLERFSHDWDDVIQTIEGGSFYLDRNGFASFSGGLNPGIPKAELIPGFLEREKVAYRFRREFKNDPKFNPVEFCKACEARIV